MISTISSSFARRTLGVFGATVAAATILFSPALAQVKKESDVRIVFVTHGQANDVYWSVVKNGVQAAAEQLGVKVEYQAPETFDVIRMARMIEAATASQPDGLVVSIPDMDALKAPITAAKAAGIPVVVIDSGEDAVAQWGLDLFVGGGSEFDNGYNAGKLMAKDGVKDGVCINHEVGNVSLDQRCEGFDKALKEAGGTSSVIATTMDPTDITRRSEAFLGAHAEVTGILSLGPTAAAPLMKMLEERGTIGSYKIGVFDLSPEVLEAVSSGKAMFAIDSQQFLMGYYPVVFLTNKAMWKTFPTQPLRTGPSFITKSDAAAVLELSKQGIR
jgi:simple sugar transport system substrate-binding protein